MKMIYDNKEINIIECRDFFSRLKGFMFQEEITYALLFNRCSSIHTFFMKSNIDVIMCDRNNKILYYYNNLGKNRVICPKRKVYKTIELPVNYYNIKVGNKVSILKK